MLQCSMKLLMRNDNYRIDVCSMLSRSRQPMNGVGATYLRRHKIVAYIARALIYALI